MSKNFFKNDYLVQVEQSSISEFIGRKIHANKFLDKTESEDLNVRYLNEGKILIFNNFNDYIEGTLLWLHK